MDEFEIIEKYFAPLTNNYDGALGLKDDAAILPQTDGNDLVITTDTIIENVHFFKDNSPEDIAIKLLGVNISDLASMGALPTCYLLSITLPKSINDKWLAEFSLGLKTAAENCGSNMKLIGGDTTVHNGPVKKGKSLTRKGANIDDYIYVTGTIGDSYAGLQILLGKCNIKSDYLIKRYLRPIPRVDIGLKLSGIATACADISDGLIADLGHICKYSNVGASIFIDDIPISTDALNSGIDKKLLITGGDDYELIFTAPKGANLPKNITKIGQITNGNIVKILDNQGKELFINNSGYKHYL